MFWIQKLILFIMFVRNTYQSKIIWSAFDIFSDPNVWSPPKLPCSQDKIVLPKNLMYGIRVPVADVRVKEVQLPVDGTITFEGLILGDGQPTPDCPGEVVEYKRNTVHAWSDPDNWRREVESSDDLLVSLDAVPDVYATPCVTDNVVIDGTCSQIGRLPTKRQYVKSISINGKTYSNKEWQAIETSFEKYAEDENILMEPPFVEIVGDEYFKEYKRGEPACQEEIPKELCANKKCETPKCLNPIKPLYHCCEICGAEITIGTMDSSLAVKLVVLSEEVRNIGVNFWVGVVGRNHVLDPKYLPTLYNKQWLSSNYNFYQIILVDFEEYDEISTRSAKKLIHILKTKFNLTDGNEMLLSGIPWAGPSVAPGGWEALIMLFVVLSALCAVMLYHYPPATLTSMRHGPFMFARFENRSRAGSLIQGISQLSLNKEFDNPMYSAKADEEDKNTIAEDLAEDYDATEIEMSSQHVEQENSEEGETAFMKTSMSALLEKENNETY